MSAHGEQVPELREVRMDGQAVIAQLMALRSMADAMGAMANSLLVALGAEPAVDDVQRPEDVLSPPVFGRK